MLIQVGYELVFNCPQTTPMILMVNVHYSRASDIVVPDCLTTDPETPITAYRDGFGNWCSRIVAPIGRIRLKSTGVVRDSGETDVVTTSAQQHSLQDLPEDTLVFLLGSRYCETDLLSRGGVVAIRSDHAGMVARPGDLRFCPQPYRVRLSESAPHANSLGGVQRGCGRLSRLRAPGYRSLPLHEYSGALLHRLPGRHGDAAALRS